MRKANKGIALISAIIVITLVSIMLTSYFAVVVSERARVTHELAGESAYYVALAGLEQAFFDLSSEYDKDQSWIDGGGANTIDGKAASVPASVGMGSEDPTERSDFQYFPDGGISWNDPFSDGKRLYSLEIAFVNNADDSDYRPNRLWVRSTGRILDGDGNVIDELTLRQLAKVKPVKNITIDGGVGRLYDTLDYTVGGVYPTRSAEGEALEGANTGHEIRIAGDRLDEDVTIALTGGKTLTVRGGFGYDFTDGSRDTSKHQTIFEDTAGADPVMTISGTGTVTMGGVRIE